MNTKKQIISVISIIMVLLISVSLLGCNSANKAAGTNTTIEFHGDWVSYSDINSLSKDSDAIIVGEIVKTSDAKKVYHQVETDEKMLSRLDEKQKAKLEKLKSETFMVFTISDVKVNKVIKGDIKLGDIISVGQLGGTIGSEVKFISDTKEYFNKNDKFMLFLKDSKENGFYTTLNPWQGHIKVDNEIIKPLAENKLFNENDSIGNVVNKISNSRK